MAVIPVAVMFLIDYKLEAIQRPIHMLSGVFSSGSSTRNNNNTTHTNQSESQTQVDTPFSDASTATITRPHTKPPTEARTTLKEAGSETSDTYSVSSSGSSD